MGRLLWTESTTPWKTVLDDGTEVVRTNAWSAPGCHPVGCGVKLYVKDGQLLKVEGDPEHPVTKGRLCPRCLALKEVVYHPDRITHPMKRVGARGEDKWEQISWDEAVQTIVTKSKEIAEQYGPMSIVLFAGTGREAVKFQYPLAAVALGTLNVCYSQSGWSCMGPRDTAVAFVLGSGYTEVDFGAGHLGQCDDPEYTLPEYVVLWGKDPLRSNADGLWGHGLIEIMKRGTKLINVDPRLNWLSSRSEHAIQLRPNTDTALALALLNVVINEDLYDHDFVDKWTYGFEELSERVQQYPPSFAAEVCGIPEEQIFEVARTLAAAKPWGLCMGLATDQNPNGVQLVQSLISLAAITGNLDVPGGTIVGEHMIVDVNLDAPVDPALQDMIIGQKEYPAVRAVLNTVQPDMMLEALETGKPYPLKMGWLDSSNLLAPTCSAQPMRWHDALRKLEFIVAKDIFMNPTIQALADIVLPVSTWAEHDGIVMTHYGKQSGIVGAINKAVSVGECKSDLEALLLFCQTAHPEIVAELPKYQSMENWLDGDMGRLNVPFSELKQHVTGVLDVGYHKHELGLNRPDGQPGFETVTGRVELYSTMFGRLGDDPLPYYEEPRFGPLSRPDLAKEYPLTLTTGARYYASFHSEHRQIPSLRQLTPDPLVEIHPDTAAELDIKDGDWVWIENPWGRAKQRARVVPIIRRDTVSAAHGWWFPEEDGNEPNLYGVWKSNVNQLIPHKEIGKLGFGAPFKGVCCKVYRAE